MPIIVASSNVFRRELSSFILSEAGYAVHEAIDSTTLLHCLDRVRPTLVILDAWLSGASGNEIVEHIRRYGPIPILVIVNGSTGRNQNGLLANQQNDMLAWPYQSEELLARVRAMLNPSANSPSMNTSAHINMAYGERSTP